MPDDVLLAFFTVGFLFICFFAAGGVVLLFALLYEGCFALHRAHTHKSLARRNRNGLR